jgi:EpsI family protein
MNKAMVSSMLMGLIMVASACGAKLMVPTHYMADLRPAAKFEAILPTEFGDWKEEKSMAAAVVNPSVESALKAIYTETVSRTYINGDGYRIMLSVAYGANQSDGLQVHYPEICYPAQGFEVTSNHSGTLATAGGVIPVKRLETDLSGERYEPVTYWTTVGDIVAMGNINRKMAEMRYRLAGEIPDGLLFRVSSVDTDAPRAFVQHAAFVNAMLQAIPARDKPRLAGLAH